MLLVLLQAAPSLLAAVSLRPSRPPPARFAVPCLSDRDSLLARKPPEIVYAANAATKWLVVAAQTSAVALRRDLVSPYIVVGAIGASFATQRLKRAINQARPAGAPFTDPGMPSSHALILVGGVLGSAAGGGWLALGGWLRGRLPARLLAVAVWSAYAGGSARALFIGVKMARWVGGDLDEGRMEEEGPPGSARDD
ncbi:hypothetical protein EMIHUDRAFT_242187 [Emiliania huxleyi CCMP1516]|uniref:Phosphatidic acid phosphatase type 2/haloperoxidase domain-containing protein n=2 Tax=Emiliania huxleyi TaxID=2903 RepID=A0A0D3J9W4_EMIH1|nr:hypothetical protein EMIHUDRAFT_242187 [Emiliania huxleyi CCMP1516]EOD20299.1 hypothetical protein EMIHUDRAFT_242187 [Emiliania huxleyi CCMP1516]|eukprot:XP_005772728.1 hypothetical protein EMIHUDRAFT_242187 [Emiliania huxleyi CCMP1516]